MRITLKSEYIVLWKCCCCNTMNAKDNISCWQCGAVFKGEKEQ